MTAGEKVALIFIAEIFVVGVACGWLCAGFTNKSIRPFTAEARTYLKKDIILGITSVMLLLVIASPQNLLHEHQQRRRRPRTKPNDGKTDGTNTNPSIYK